MILTVENYHSLEANRTYLSMSQYKDFCGTLGMIGCEAYALAKIKGEWEDERTAAMTVSSYVDAHVSGTLDVFKAKNPEIFKKNGDLKAEFVNAQEIINRFERDAYFMKYLAGNKQVVMTADINGVAWKVLIDSFIPDVVIVDLKVMQDLRKKFWVRDYGHVSFIEQYGYDLQAAVYQRVVYENTGKRLPFIIAAASKEKSPDIEIIGIDNQRLDDIMIEVLGNVPRIMAIKNGEAEPDRCEQCDYCRATKVLTKPIHYTELVRMP